MAKFATDDIVAIFKTPTLILLREKDFRVPVTRGLTYYNLWCQCAPIVFEPFTGSRFTIELELSPQPVPGVSAFNQRARFPRLLDAADLRSMLDVHNEIVGKFRMPSDEEYERVMGFPQMDAPQTFAARFARRDRPIGNEDFWMQYRDKEDVTLWAVFIRDRLAKTISSFRSPDHR